MSLTVLTSPDHQTNQNKTQPADCQHKESNILKYRNNAGTIFHATIDTIGAMMVQNRLAAGEFSGTSRPPMTINGSTDRQRKRCIALKSNPSELQSGR